MVRHVRSWYVSTVARGVLVRDLMLTINEFVQFSGVSDDASALCKVVTIVAGADI